MSAEQATQPSPPTDVRYYDIRPLAHRAWSHDSQADGSSYAETVAAMINLVQDSVAADTWMNNGGQLGVIYCIGGQLIVTQTDENHAQIVKLLADFERQYAGDVNPPTNPGTN